MRGMERLAAGKDKDRKEERGGKENGETEIESAEEGRGSRLR